MFHTFRHRLISFFPGTFEGLYQMAGLIFFFSIFNGIVGYLVPLEMAEEGYSKTVMGVLYATSSVVGAIYDIIASKYLRNTHWRRMFLFMFFGAFFFPLLLMRADRVLLFIAAMAAWGIYYDFFSFGRFDYTGKLSHARHASAWGIMNAALSAGMVIAPFLAGYLVSDVIGWQPYALSFVFLICAFGVFVFMRRQADHRHISRQTMPPPRSWHRELRLMRTVGWKIFPALLLTLFLSTLDAFFWVIGPLIAEDRWSGSWGEGLFLSAYFLPALLIGGLVGNFVTRYGKKRTAFAATACGSAVLLCLYAWPQIGLWPFVTVAFFSSFFISLAWPAINGAYADYISEGVVIEREIQSVEDFASNSGYVIGPILAGLFADFFGDIEAFAVLGLIGVLLCVLLLWTTPRHIKVSHIH